MIMILWFILDLPVSPGVVSKEVFEERSTNNLIDMLRENIATECFPSLFLSEYNSLDGLFP